MSEHEPTPDDLARDLAADLAMVRQAGEARGLVWPLRLTEAALRRAIAAEAERDDAAAVCHALEAAVRRHRDLRGDDRCWLDDEELYRALPEGYTPPTRDTTVELDRCRQYIACRHNPATGYVSPQRRIEELEARLRELEAAADVVSCAFCGFACRKSDPDVVPKLAGHMAECARHPMAAVLHDHGDLKARLASALERLAVQAALLARRDEDAVALAGALRAGLRREEGGPRA